MDVFNRNEVAADVVKACGLAKSDEAEVHFYGFMRGCVR